MRACRLGAVGYLNARPLVYGLEHDGRFSLRFDVPSVCADLLHRGEIDFGLIPAIEFARAPGYGIVPNAAVASDGAVDSVALFTTRPRARIRRLALDTSSRTSVALTRILCRYAFDIAPVFEPVGPDIGEMLTRCDAALLIGDPALFLDHRALGVEKIDLGEAWTTLTGLPFVWAFWAGHPAASRPEIVDALEQARWRGEAATDEIAERHAHGDPERAARIRHYLRMHIKHDLTGRFEAGLRRYYELAGELGLIAGPVELRYFTGSAVPILPA